MAFFVFTQKLHRLFSIHTCLFLTKGLEASKFVRKVDTVLWCVLQCSSQFFPVKRIRTIKRPIGSFLQSRQSVIKPEQLGGEIWLCLSLGQLVNIEGKNQGL